jgi:hypothetical protein
LAEAFTGDPPDDDLPQLVLGAYGETGRTFRLGVSRHGAAISPKLRERKLEKRTLEASGN